MAIKTNTFVKIIGGLLRPHTTVEYNRLSEECHNHNGKRIPPGDWFYLPDKRLVIIVDGNMVYATYTSNLHGVRGMYRKLEQTLFAVDLSDPKSLDIVVEKIIAFEHPQSTSVSG